jgi:hypothetical protein
MAGPAVLQNPEPQSPNHPAQDMQAPAPLPKRRGFEPITHRNPNSDT